MSSETEGGGHGTGRHGVIDHWGQATARQPATTRPKTPTPRREAVTGRAASRAGSRGAACPCRLPTCLTSPILTTC